MREGGGGREREGEGREGGGGRERGREGGREGEEEEERERESGRVDEIRCRQGKVGMAKV